MRWIVDAMAASVEGRDPPVEVEVLEATDPGAVAGTATADEGLGNVVLGRVVVERQVLSGRNRPYR